jgi:hypothetical protein
LKRADAALEESQSEPQTAESIVSATFTTSLREQADPWSEKIVIGSES